jgi:hypothetical protein
VRNRVLSISLTLLATVFLLRAVPLAGETPLPADRSIDVRGNTRACQGLERNSDETLLDGCCVQCVAEIREVAALSTTYTSTARYWRLGLISLSILGAGGFLWLASIRSRRLRLNPLWTISGGLLILILIAALGSLVVTWLTAEDGRKLVTADWTMRQLTALGLIPDSNPQAHIHCAELIAVMTQRSDSTCRNELLSYEGAFDRYDKIVGPLPQMKEELSRRAQDAIRLVNGVQLRTDQSPRTPGQVLSHNEHLTEVADARLGWLRFLWLDAIAVVLIGAVLAWLVAVSISALRRRSHLKKLVQAYIS